MLDQSGIIENVNYDRYNVRSNVEGNITIDPGRLLHSGIRDVEQNVGKMD